MKKSFLFSVFMLATIPVYMAFIISRSPKNPHNVVTRYMYPEINTFNIENGVTVGVKACDTPYMECKGCDTAGIYKQYNLQLKKTDNGLGAWVSFITFAEEVNYVLGVKSLYRLESDRNNYYVSGFRQNKMLIALNAGGKVCLSDCEIDTLVVTCRDWLDKELKLTNKSMVKHILMDAGAITAEFRFSCENSNIENLVVNNITDSNFRLTAPA